MIRVIIAGVVALLVGVGAGTTFGVLTAPKPKAAAPAGADSTAVAHAQADSLAKPAHSTTRPVDAVPAAAAGSTVGPAPAANPPEPGRIPADRIPAGVLAAARGAAVPPAEPLSYRQVAKILSNMNPQDAVKIVAYLSDEHVEGILNELGVRPAAALLSQLPTERAARLSERLLHQKPEAR